MRVCVFLEKRKKIATGIEARNRAVEVATVVTAVSG